MRFILILSLLVFSGCSKGMIFSDQWKICENACHKNEGVKFVWGTYSRDSVIYCHCNNGADFIIDPAPYKER